MKRIYFHLHQTSWGILVFLFALLSSSLAEPTQVLEVKDFGAINDGQTLNTQAIQQAIDSCHRSGGGMVRISGGGIYVTGTLYLKSYVTLHLANGTTLQGSTHLADYGNDTHYIMYRRESHMDPCLIYAENAESIALEGYGTIDGNGFPQNFPKSRPMLIRFKDCRRIHLNNLRLLNPAAWTTAFLYCEDISVNGISIYSRANKNGDGLDFDGCQNVRVANCNFDNSDDCICLQTSLPDRPCKNVVITNCTFKTKWAGLRIGLLSRGNIENVTVSNCTFQDIQDAGLKIQQNEGGEMHHLTFQNLVMENVPRPIFMTFTQQRAARNYPEGTLEPLKSMHHFSFSQILVDNRKGDKNAAILITGIPQHRIEDIVIRDLQLLVAGGGTKEDSLRREVKEYTLEVMHGHWPEFSNLGTLPCHGLFARHVKGLTLENISIQTFSPDLRPPLMFRDVLSPKLHQVEANREPIALQDVLTY